MLFATTFFLAGIFIPLACAKTVVVTVGESDVNPTVGVFHPASVVAKLGDVVLFNFTEGNHTATQSTFAEPCVPAHITNSTINGFDSSFRDTHNGTAVTTLSFTVTDPNTTVWFFDWNTCAQGGVGGININDSSLETLDGAQRNAIRLNGTNSTTSSSDNSSSSTSATATATSTSPASSSTTSATSAANHAIVHGLSVVVPALAALVALSL